MYPLTFTVHEYYVQCFPFENYLKHVENFRQNLLLHSSFGTDCNGFAFDIIIYN